MKNVVAYHVNGLLSIEEVIEVYLVLGWPLKMHQDVVYNKQDGHAPQTYIIKSLKK